MIDIHCHILHGLDDGAKDLDEAIEMAKIAYADGVRHIIATPHFTNGHLGNLDRILSKLEQLQIELDRLRLDITLHPGNEVRLESRSFLEEHLQAGSFHYLALPRKYILLEQRWQEYEPETPYVVDKLLDRGVVPIIPHPERHFFFRDNPELLIRLIEAGAWTQVSADSLNGSNGEDAKRFAEWLADRDYIHTLATDAHNLRRRPNLSEGYAIISRRINEARAEEILARAQQIIA